MMKVNPEVKPTEVAAVTPIVAASHGTSPFDIVANAALEAKASLVNKSAAAFVESFGAQHSAYATLAKSIVDQDNASKDAL